MNLQIKEWTTYLVILIFCSGLFWVITPKIAYQPTGIALPMTHIISQNIMTNPNWTSSSKPTQWINVEYHVKNDSQEARQLVIKKAMSLARAAGAHTVMMQPLFFADTTEQSPMLSVIIGHGIAVK